MWNGNFTHSAQVRQGNIDPSLFPKYRVANEAQMGSFDMNTHIDGQATWIGWSGLLPSGDTNQNQEEVRH